MDENEYDAWYNSLTEEERISLGVRLCRECYHAFDDNPTRLICKTCEDWIVEETDLYV